MVLTTSDVSEVVTVCRSMLLAKYGTECDQRSLERFIADLLYGTRALASALQYMSATPTEVAGAIVDRVQTWYEYAGATAISNASSDDDDAYVWTVEQALRGSTR
jgi:hypothetical protein